MKMCDCEDFPCCNCGQEYMAQMQYERTYGYEPEYDPDAYLYDYDAEADDEWVEDDD